MVALQELQRSNDPENLGSMILRAVPPLLQLLVRVNGSSPAPAASEQLAAVVEEVMDVVQPQTGISPLLELLDSIMERLQGDNSVDSFASFVHLVLEPIQEYVSVHLLNGREPSQANLADIVETLIRSLQSPLRNVVRRSLSRQALDCVHTINAFLRTRLQQVIIIFSNTNVSFSSIIERLLPILLSTLTEFGSLCRHFLPAGQQAMDETITRAVAYLLAALQSERSNDGAWIASAGVQVSRLLTDVTASQPQDNIRRYLVTEDAATRMEEELYQGYENMRLSSPPTMDSGNSDTTEVERMITVSPSNGQVDEAMEIVASEEEVITTPSDNVPRRQPWHAAVPQEWIPVIAGDVDRQQQQQQQQQAVGGLSAHSDGYMCGVPYKRRRLAAQHKPRGGVNSVMQDTLRASLRGAGINAVPVPVMEAISGEASQPITEAFTSHVRSSLRRNTIENKDSQTNRFSSFKRNL